MNPGGENGADGGPADESIDGPEKGESADRVYVTDAAEFEPGDRAVVEVQGVEIAVMNVDGDLHAVGNYCPHMGGPCAQGRVSGMFNREIGEEMRRVKEGGVVSCPWHGWEFDLTTGRHEGHSGARLPVYDTVLADGSVYVVTT